ncbi:hypothetical protein O6H91_13G003100 [Diphasiastrum complanatum]|uniref:Uncharacterized protein n=1 Tax=Diphasiastrum complanatum TaxID=34168 RepID=A0ACC2BRW4_DIPCM|nr:hypothetical protein O6H91_13G003100 [Diphasiastrum complanatum]
MRTRGAIKKTPTPKKGGSKTPTKGSVEIDVEAVAISEEVQEAKALQSPSAEGTAEAVTPEAAKVDAEVGLELEAGDANAGGCEPSVVASTENRISPANAGQQSELETDEGIADVKQMVADIDGSKVTKVVIDLEEEIEKDDTCQDDEVDGDEEDEEKAEDEVEDEVEDEIEEEVEDMEEDEVEDKGAEGLQVDDEVEDIEDEVDYEDEELKAQHEINEAIKESENDMDRTLLEMQDSGPISERRKGKRLEVFVGGIDKDASDNDLRTVFEKVGKVTEVRISRNSQTGKNKGYAFVRYADPSEAKKAINELHGSEICGKSCRVIPSEENDLLYLGNINKFWKKEKLVEALDTYKIEKLEDVTLLEDPQNQGQNRGYAFLEFTTHKDAMRAFNRLRQRDAIVGGDRTAKVAWAQPLGEPDEDTMAQVKTVFIDGLPPKWDEERVKEHFGNYGQIEKVVLGRDKASSKRKDYGFVDYATREAALACIEAANNTEVGEGEQKVKLKVRLSKPVFKSRSGKGGIRDGRGHGSGRDGRVRTGKKSLGRRRDKLVLPRSRGKASREDRSDYKSGRSAPSKKSKFSSPLPSNDFALRRRKSKFSSPPLDRRGSQRERFSGRDARSPGEIRRDRFRLEEAYLHRRAEAREYAPEAYAATSRDLREPARGRKRGYLDLEHDARYVEVPQTGRSRARLAHPNSLQLAVGGSQYARIPYYESPATRAPVGHVARYAVGQGVGLPAAPMQSYPIYDPLSSASGNTAYSAGGYPYGSVYSNGAEITRGASYVSSSYGVPPHGSSRYSVPGANLGRYY